MSDPIDFYFDFSSPYGYFAAQGLEKVVAPFDRIVRWHPILIGVVMQKTGAEPLANVPMKGDYMARDCERLARFMDVPWQIPEPFPVSTVTAARAFYGLEQKDGGDQTRAVAFAKQVYRAYFAAGQNISDTSVVGEVLTSVSGGDTNIEHMVSDPSVKARLRAEIETSMERGVFGSPFVLVDDEPFWGADRFWMIKRWLKRGGW